METKILGSAFTVTSGLKIDEIQALQRFSPKDLTVFDAEDKKTPIFKIGLDPCASLNRNGVSFNGANSDGYAQATIGIPAASQLQRPIAGASRRSRRAHRE